MANIRSIQLNPQQRAQLEKGYRNAPSHAFRKRCHLVLLKAEERTSKDVGAIVSMHQNSVNHWLNRYEKEGIDGLNTKPGRGRKPIIDPRTDTQIVRKAVEQERQRLRAAKELLETELNKSFSLKTLKRFLKKTAVDTNAFD